MQTTFREILAGEAADAFLAGDAGGEYGAKNEAGAQLVPGPDVFFNGPSLDTPDVRFYGAQQCQPFADGQGVLDISLWRVIAGRACKNAEG